MKKDESYKGFETWFSGAQMTAKMHLHIFLFLFILQVVGLLLGLFVFKIESGDILVQGAGYLWQACLSFDFGRIKRILNVVSERFWELSWPIILLSFGVYALYPVFLAKFKIRAKKQSERKYISGSKLIEAGDLNKAIKAEDEKTYLNIGAVAMPISAEPKHGFIVGRPGVGKTVLMSGIIDQLRQRGNKGVIYDFKGDYLSKFYNPDTDLIFNPLDSRGLSWNIFDEIETVMDIDAISSSLIPSAQQSDPFWHDAARDVFSGILHSLYRSGKRTNADVWEAVSKPVADIAAMLQGCKGAERGFTYIQDASGKQALSVIAVMMQYAKAFEFLGSGAGSFSVKKWLDNKDKGFIFVTNYSDTKDTLRPILSLFVDLLGRKLLSMKDDYNRRIFFLLDEFGTLQKLSTIIQLLTLARSKGGSVWIGIQDIGQIDKLYGPEHRQSIVNACGNTAMFSVADPVTAKFLSDRIGDTTFMEVEESYSMGTADNRDGVSLSRKQKIEKLVLPSDFMRLPDLSMYLKIVNFDFCLTSQKYRDFDSKHIAFEMRSELKMSNITSPVAVRSETASGGKTKEEVEIKQESKEQDNDNLMIDEFNL